MRKCLWLIAGVVFMLIGPVWRTAATASAAPKQSRASAVGTQHPDVTQRTQPPTAPTAPDTTRTGIVYAIDLQVTPALLQLNAGNSNVIALVVDPRMTQVSQGGQAGSLEQLAAGASIEVRFAPQNGQYVAKAITILKDAPKAAAPSAKAMPAEAPAELPADPSEKKTHD